MAPQTGNPAVVYETQTNTLGIAAGTVVESFLYVYDDDGPISSTVLFLFLNSAVVSSFTSESPMFEQLSAAVTTTMPAQTTSTTLEVEVSTEQHTTITAQAQPSSSTSSSTTQAISTSPTFTAATTSPTTQYSTDMGPASPIPSPGLSSSAKTGIGIGASLGVLSLALLLFSIYRCLKHKKRSRQMHAANIPPILPSPSGTAVNEGEKRLAMGSPQLGSIGYGDNSTAQTPMKESTDGLASLYELGGVPALTAPRELSGISTVEHARDSGGRSAVGRPELA